MRTTFRPLAPPSRTKEGPNVKARDLIHANGVDTETGVMSNEDFLNHARECFRQAAEGTNPNNMRLLVELGLEYLRLAQRAAAVTGGSPDDDADPRMH
jgi:hypothetical protein